MFCGTVPPLVASLTRSPHEWEILRARTATIAGSTVRPCAAWSARPPRRREVRLRTRLFRIGWLCARGSTSALPFPRHLWGRTADACAHCRAGLFPAHPVRRVPRRCALRRGLVGVAHAATTGE